MVQIILEDKYTYWWYNINISTIIFPLDVLLHEIQM